MKFLKLISSIVLFAFLFSCQQQSVPAIDESSSQTIDLAEESLAIGTAIDTGTIRDIGQVKYIGVEGGFWGIIGSNGNYEPVNLPKKYCVDGMWVMFTAKVRDDMASIRMWGRIIEIIRIEKIEGRIINDIGVVKRSLIQGTPWLIEGVKATYQPVNLPKEYQKQGLLVRFSAKLRSDVITIPNLWPVIEILKIEKVTDPIVVNIGEEFKLPVTKSVYEPDAKILMTFDKVIADSRCPEGAVCFWEGEAIIEVSVVIKSKDYGTFKLSTRPSASMIYVGEYSISLNALYPYPKLNSEVKEEYVGYFTIRKIIISAY